VAGGYEDVVLGILAYAGAMQLDEMGLTARNLEAMKRIIAKPYGLILAVGATGSGKTKSLHALLGHVNKPDIKIWTAEDPIEITQSGLRQTEVKPRIGVDFVRLMRAFLGVLAQRLTRRLCLDCREEYALTRDEFEMIRSDYGENDFSETGIKYDSDMALYRPAGCEACSETGYRGRMGIHELMEETGTSN